MRTRNKVVVGIAAAGLAVIGLVMLAAAQGGAGMMGRNAVHMMGGAAASNAGSTGTCSMSRSQCSAGVTGAASCPGMTSGTSGRASCPGMKANGTCKMSGGSATTTCPMTQGNTGA